MAATLPPINPGGAKKVPSYAENQSHNAAPGSPSGKKMLKPIKGANRKEKELHEKRIRLRQLQKDLTKAETATYRNTFRHTLCLSMLREGFHLSFRELFILIHEQLDERQRRGPESLMWTQTMLEDEHEKLEVIKKFLTKAETAQRNEDFLEVYNCRYELACYFQQTGDKWLADHFFKTCLNVSQSTDIEGGKVTALGECNVGLSLEENGDVFEAARHFEMYYDLAKDHKEDWCNTDDDGNQTSFHKDACTCLFRIYTAIGNRLESVDSKQSLEYLIKAFDKAEESGDKKIGGEAAYRLGLAYEKIGDTETSLKHLQNFYEICQQSGNHEGMGRACDAIAKTYIRQGNKNEAIRYLEQFVKTAEENGMDKELSLACHNLGNVLNSLGRYKESGDYFNRAYNISRAIGENASIQVNRVQSGVAQAHAMMRLFSAHVTRGNSTCLTRIIDWKSVRQNSFEPLPRPSTEQQVASGTKGKKVNINVNAADENDNSADVNENAETAEEETTEENATTAEGEEAPASTEEAQTGETTEEGQ